MHYDYGVNNPKFNFSAQMSRYWIQSARIWFRVRPAAPKQFSHAVSKIEWR